MGDIEEYKARLHKRLGVEHILNYVPTKEERISSAMEFYFKLFNNGSISQETLKRLIADVPNKFK